MIPQKDEDVQGDEYVNVSTTKLHTKSEAIYENVSSDKPRYAEPTAITRRQNTGFSMQENPAYKVTKMMTKTRTHKLK